MSKQIQSGITLQEVQKRVKELEESELKFRFLAEHTIDVIALLDTETIYTYISGSVTKITGYTPSEMVGRSAFDFVHPDDIQYMKMRIAGLADRNSLEFSQFRHKTKDENYVWIESSANYTFDDAGNATGLIVNARDISARKTAEEKLTLSEANLKSIIDNTKETIVLLDRNCNLLSFNKSYIANVKGAWGLEPVIGENVFKFTSKKNQKKNKVLYERALAGESFTAEIEYVTGDLVRYVEVALNPISLNGEISGISVFATDITEKKSIDNLLLENQQMLKSIMDNTSSIVFVKDLKGHYILVNKGFEQTYNITEADIKGKTDFYFLPEAIAKVKIAADKKIIEGQPVLELEEYIPHKDGIHTYFVSKFPLFNNKKEIYGVCSISIDITKRKRAEEELVESTSRMNAVLENSADSIWSVDKDLKLISFNISYFESAKLFFEIEPYIGMPILKHLTHQAKKKWAELYSRALNGEHFSEEIEDKTAGMDLFFDVSFNPIIINNEITGVAIFARDITSRKNIEHLLEYKVKELNTFMYKATHDLRSPLVSVMGIVQLAKDQEMSDELKKYFGMIDLSVHRMDNLLIDLVKIVNVSQGKLIIEEIDFNSMIDEILLSLSHYPDFSEIIFRRQVHSDCVFKSDKRLLYSILQNLIDNAIKYKRMPSRTEPMIIITVNVSPKQVQIGITDNGLGMPEKIHEKVFEMFYRGSSSAQGTGLGLYIVKSSVEKMGGKIMLDSIEGRGTSINLIIPNLEEEKTHP